MRVEQENVLTQMQLQISNSVFIPTRATLLESLVSFPQSRKDYFYTLRQRHWRFVNNRYNVSCECFRNNVLEFCRWAASCFAPHVARKTWPTFEIWPITPTGCCLGNTTLFIKMSLGLLTLLSHRTQRETLSCLRFSTVWWTSFNKLNPLENVCPFHYLFSLCVWYSAVSKFDFLFVVHHSKKRAHLPPKFFIISFLVV